MCGITGLNTNNKELAEKILTSIDHRGPDYRGIWSNQDFTLGHQLLSIRSEEKRSRQPWATNNSPWALVFNGQIYNTEEIRKILPQKYHTEELDTSLIFGLVEKYGWDFIQHIQGMFAIGLYNTEEKVLRLYRDQSGQKNIYYTSGISTFIFCSEIKGITEHLSVSHEVDRDALIIASSIGYIPGDKTLLSHIKKVRPGEIVTRHNNGKLAHSYYNSLSKEFDSKTPTEVMSYNTQNHLMSKKQVALNLSGGMDSSALLHEMKELGHEMRTYTTRFVSEDSNLNVDADLALKLSKDYGTNHTEIEITSDIYLNNLINSCEIIEEPNYNISLATYLEVAKTEGINGDGNRVILSGDGGDEIFGGYPTYKKSLHYKDLMNKITPLGFNAYKAIRDKEYWDYKDTLTQWVRMKFFFFGISNKKTTLSYLRNNTPPEWTARDKDPVRDMMMLDRFFWLSSENFIRSDKLYMSQSLELRSPLSYEPLRKYFDSKLSTNDYFKKGSTNKLFLRNMYRNKLPSYITERKDKTGWRSPVKVWWNKEYRDLFCSVFENAPKGENIDWNKISNEVMSKEVWPGKYFHLYLSLAVLSKKFNLPL